MIQLIYDRKPLVLGTVQLGLPYGLTNKIGKPDDDLACAIVAAAWSGGVRKFDTAQAYGDSEAVLGRALRALAIAKNALIISKLHPELDFGNYDALFFAVERSLERLGCDRLNCLMLHRENQLDYWKDGLSANLAKIVSERLAESIGVSVYTPARALQALNTPGLDCVQIPSNIFDRRFEEAGIFDLAVRLDKKIYVRSIYLQGLILLRPEELPVHLRFAEDPVRALSLLAKKMGLSNIELAMGFVKSAYPSAEIVFGAETVEQVQDNLRLWFREYPENLVTAVRGCFAEVAESICNPMLWPIPKKQNQTIDKAAEV